MTTLTCRFLFFVSLGVIPALSLLTCNVNLNADDGDLGPSHPLLLRKNTEDFFYPKKCNADNRVELSFCRGLRASCAKGDLMVNGRSMKTNEANLKCWGVDVFRVGNNFLATQLKDVSCSDPLTAQLSKIGDSCINGVTGRIGFSLNNNKWADIVEKICHNEMTGDTNWVYHRLSGAVRNRQQETLTPTEFQLGPFYQNIIVNSSIFARDNQIARLAMLLNNETLANDVYDGNMGDYLVPVTLAPAGDMFYREQQNNVYYYANTVPMWMSIRDGNWKKVENVIRDVAGRDCRLLEIYSGGLDSLTYSDNNNTQIPFTLTTTRATASNNDTTPALTVPRQLFKYVIDRKKNKALVFVTVNDPTSSTNPPPSAELLCPDERFAACAEKYPEFKTSRGYTYCCAVDRNSAAGKRLIMHGLPILKNPRPLDLGAKANGNDVNAWAPIFNDFLSNLIDDRESGANDEDEDDDDDEEGDAFGFDYGDDS